MVAPLPLPILGGVFELGTKLIDHFFPNKEQADEAKLKLLEMQQNGALAELTATTQLALKQGDINLEEAKKGYFTWREGVGWTCALALFFKYIGGPSVFVLAQFFGFDVELPVIEAMELTPLLIGMLGLPMTGPIGARLINGKQN